MSSPDGLASAAEKLHALLLRRHFREGLLSGPDYGVRFNFRAWRFLKSTLDFISWHDDYVFMQTQGYWVLVNWLLYERTGEPRYREIALATTEGILRLQTREGFWAYPLPERKHLVATVEGSWGALGLLASHTCAPRDQFLDGAIRWYDFLISRIGFQAHHHGKAINYFDKPRGKVPNNSMLAVWLFLRLWSETGQERFLAHINGLFEFLASVQRPSGEFPYVVESPYERRREHYLCFQYNSFQFLELAWSAALGPGQPARALLPALAQFLERGVNANGASALACSTAGRAWPEVDYYTAVLAAALSEAAKLGLADRSLSARCYARLLERQRPDGSFSYSTGDYRFLNDHRSYPRAQVMTLFHLLCGADNRRL